MLLASPVQAVTTTAPKPGTLCKQLGLKKLSRGIAYSCVKRGSKLVWNTGTRVPAKPSPNAATGIALVSDEIQRRITADWARWKSKGVQYKGHPYIVIPPGHNSEWTKLIYDNTISLLGVMEGNGQKLVPNPSFIYSDDRDSLIPQIKSIGCISGLVTPAPNLGIYCGRVQVGVTTFLLGAANASEFNQGQPIPESTKRRLLYYAMHDLALFVELQAQYGDIQYSGIKNQIPAWIREGAVQLIALLQLHDAMDSSGTYLQNVQWGNGLMDPLEAKPCARSLQDFEGKDRNWTPSCTYSQNFHAVSLLVANHGGLKALFTFAAEYGKNEQEWTTPFETAFGISREAFYSEWYDYLRIPVAERPTLTPPTPVQHA